MAGTASVARLVPARLDDAVVGVTDKASRWQSLPLQLGVISIVAAGLMVWQTIQLGGFTALWLTPDQQGRLAFDDREFQRAFERFEDPEWKGIAAYYSGLYDDAADAFGRMGSATGFFNRGNAFMKNREYRKAIVAFEQAVAEAPGWTEAEENLELARYVLDYIERVRESSDTGEEAGIGADDVVFDNESGRGTQTEVTEDTRVEAQSAEKWMRSVDTDTRDFLRTRFLLESQRREAP